MYLLFVEKIGKYNKTNEFRNSNRENIRDWIINIPNMKLICITCDNEFKDSERSAIRSILKELKSALWFRLNQKLKLLLCFSSHRFVLLQGITIMSSDESEKVTISCTKIFIIEFLLELALTETR